MTLHANMGWETKLPRAEFYIVAGKLQKRHRAIAQISFETSNRTERKK